VAETGEEVDATHVVDYVVPYEINFDQQHLFSAGLDQLSFTKILTTISRFSPRLKTQWH